MTFAFPPESNNEKKRQANVIDCSNETRQTIRRLREAHARVGRALETPEFAAADPYHTLQLLSSMMKCLDELKRLVGEEEARRLFDALQRELQTD